MEAVSNAWQSVNGLIEPYYPSFGGDVVSLLSAWAFYYTFVHVLYYGGGWFMRIILRTIYPKSGTLSMPKKLMMEHITMSEIAFPLYVCVPAVSDFLRHKHLTKMCDDVASCGGWQKSLINFGIYMFLVEAGVFWVHYWLLHIFPWGKKYLNHAKHHSFRYEEEMTSFSGFAFEAVDGFSQGMPFLIFQCLVPIPASFAIFIGGMTGVWTLYIHLGNIHAPWPLMGPDYHTIHHIYNWYNFGMYTRFFDWLFGTLRQPVDKREHSKEAENVMFKGLGN